MPGTQDLALNKCVLLLSKMHILYKTLLKYCLLEHRGNDQGKLTEMLSAVGIDVVSTWPKRSQRTCQQALSAFQQRFNI